MFQQDCCCLAKAETGLIVRRHLEYSDERVTNDGILGQDSSIEERGECLDIVWFQVLICSGSILKVQLTSTITKQYSRMIHGLWCEEREEWSYHFLRWGRVQEKQDLGWGREVWVIRIWVLDSLLGMSIRSPSGNAEKAVGDKSLVSKKSPSQDIYQESSHRLYLKPWKWMRSFVQLQVPQ